MAAKIGTADIGDARIGSTPVDRLYHGANLFWSRSVAQLTDVTASVTTSAPATAWYEVRSNGKVYRSTIGGAVSYYEDWLLSGAAGDYQVRATVTSGSVSGSATGSWLALTSTRAWSVTDNFAGGPSATANITVEIRDTATNTVRASASITLNANALL